MADIRKITDAKKYVQSFDRFFLSASAVKDDAAADFLVNFLLSLTLKPNSIILNRQTYTTLQSNGKLAKLAKLKEKGLLLDKVFGTDYKSAVKGLYEKQKRYKILLITIDEAEGVDFEKLDMIDNRINDIDAAGFDKSGNWIQFLYKLPKEDVVFKAKPNSNVDSLNIVFYKTEVSGAYTPLYGENDPRSLAKKSGGSFSFAIDKNELFESDKVVFIAKAGGQTLRSDYNDFFFGDVQSWYLNISAGRLSAHNTKQGFDEEVEAEKTNKPVDVDVDITVPESEKFVYYGDRKNPKKIAIPQDKKITSVLKFDNYQNLTGTKLRTDRGMTVTIGKYINKGGEGFIYFSSQPDMVIKLFNDGCRTANRKDKIEFMSKKRITHPCIAWPQDSLYDSGGNFVGYQMMCVPSPKGLGDLDRMVKSQAFKDSISKEELVTAVVSICNTMDYLHKRNIVLGDIKLENFVVKDSDYKNKDYSRIVFVDCDSYQIDKFPATALTPGYVAPETDMSKVSQQYRSIEYDRYSLFALIFRIFMNRMFPYSRIRREDEPDEDFDTAARHGIFPYKLSDDGSTEAMAPKCGGCANLWSHFPKYVKQAFIDNADKKTGKCYGPDNRKHADEWEKIFRCYLNDIKNGKLKADKSYNIGYPVKDKTAYSNVDIEMIREISERLAKVSVRSAVKFALIKAGIKPDGVIDKVIAELTNKGSYKDKNIEIKLRRNLGVYYEIEYVYLG